jgi:hypothetical protein
MDRQTESDGQADTVRWIGKLTGREALVQIDILPMKIDSTACVALPPVTTVSAIAPAVRTRRTTNTRSSLFIAVTVTSHAYPGLHCC